MKYCTKLIIDGQQVGEEHPTFFIADIASNHDGSITRAIELIHLAKLGGANAAKFQHFAANSIVSDVGFRSLGTQSSHQAKWAKSVYEVYKDASLNQDWTPILRDECARAGITFLTSPYSFQLVDHVDPFVPAYKIGSGDITWIEMIRYIASKGKPVILATGASSMDDVERAVFAATSVSPQFALMQCNTNYTGSIDNFKHIQLNVLKSYRAMYPKMVLGLSDHTPGIATVLGAVALGAKIIEKHFTDDAGRDGPDHAFSITPNTWKEMVDRTRELELALGSGVKAIEENEKQTVVLQRRAIRVARNICAGETLAFDDVEFLRPCPIDGLPPYRVDEVMGRILRREKVKGEHLSWNDFD